MHYDAEMELNAIVYAFERAVHATDREELKGLLRRLQWTHAELEAHLAHRHLVRTTIQNFINMKHGKRSWKDGRKVQVIRKEVEYTEDDKKSLEYKGYTGTIRAVDDDERCVVELDATLNRKTLKVSSWLLLDVA
jgi:hypothetical protein